MTKGLVGDNREFPQRLPGEKLGQNTNFVYYFIGQEITDVLSIFA